MYFVVICDLLVLQHDRIKEYLIQLRSVCESFRMVS
jgi:hypothetical protein